MIEGQLLKYGRGTIDNSTLDIAEAQLISCVQETLSFQDRCGEGAWPWDAFD